MLRHAWLQSLDVKSVRNLYKQAPALNLSLHDEKLVSIEAARFVEQKVLYVLSVCLCVCVCVCVYVLRVCVVCAETRNFPLFFHLHKLAHSRRTTKRTTLQCFPNWTKPRC